MQSLIQSQDDPILLPKQTAELLGIEESTLATWRCKQRYPLRYIKLGKLIRYKKSDVLAFIDSCARAATARGNSDAPNQPPKNQAQAWPQTQA